MSSEDLNSLKRGRARVGSKGSERVVSKHKLYLHNTYMKKKLGVTSDDKSEIFTTCTPSFHRAIAKRLTCFYVGGSILKTRS